MDQAVLVEMVLALTEPVPLVVLPEQVAVVVAVQETLH